MTLYEELRAAGCELDSHESDLYVKATPQAEAIICRHACCANRFVSQVDGSLWWDVPFMFDPWWEARPVPPPPRKG